MTTDRDRDAERFGETEQFGGAEQADRPEPELRYDGSADDGAGTIGRVADLGRDLGRDIGTYIRLQRSHAKISLRQLSRLAGVSNPYLSQIERGLRRPSAEILQQIAKGLRISAEALYVQAGILDHPVGGPVAEAVHADTHLTERQKQVLIDIYGSFRRENESVAGAAPETDDTDPVGPGATGPASKE